MFHKSNVKLLLKINGVCIIQQVNLLFSITICSIAQLNFA